MIARNANASNRLFPEMVNTRPTNTEEQLLKSIDKTLDIDKCNGKQLIALFRIKNKLENRFWSSRIGGFWNPTDLRRLLRNNPSAIKAANKQLHSPSGKRSGQQLIVDGKGRIVEPQSLPSQSAKPRQSVQTSEIDKLAAQLVKAILSNVG